MLSVQEVVWIKPDAEAIVELGVVGVRLDGNTGLCGGQVEQSEVGSEVVMEGEKDALLRRSKGKEVDYVKTAILFLFPAVGYDSVLSGVFLRGCFADGIAMMSHLHCSLTFEGSNLLILNLFQAKLAPMVT